METLWMLCEQTECAAECVYQVPVLETLVAPVVAILNGHQVKTDIPTHLKIHVLSVVVNRWFES